MNIPTKLLCPTDFSDNSMVGVRYAVALAKTFGAKLELLHVHHLPAHKSDRAAPTRVDQLDSSLRQQIDRSLRDVVAELGAEASGVEITTSVDVGVPYERIAEHAKSPDIDMVVMSTLGVSGVARFLLGSVAERTVRACGKPVLTVPAH